eukprot:CAMPEP_0172700078 /NCGR_PEP_ID=MMETSP1074-20121228/30645_1 /TAXON_ID=2916 /ORGANISM="Ceratium fusus, Strain PA161109" /LENGTH=141 /DNA_ID=CAMNT_0013521393 /DNA_START=39 /DNA_END=462 /DNA_ORIENTATION=+
MKAITAPSNSNNNQGSMVATPQQQQPLLLKMELLLPLQCMFTRSCKVVLFVTWGSRVGPKPSFRPCGGSRLPQARRKSGHSARRPAGRVLRAGPLDVELAPARRPQQLRLEGRGGAYPTVNTDNPVKYKNLLRLIFAFVVV